MKDVHMDLEEAALMIREFKVIGNPGKELLSVMDTIPMMKKNITNKIKKKPLLKPIVIRTPIATRLKKRINYEQQFY